MNAILGAQHYPWSQIYGREGKELSDHLDEVFTLLRECGIAAWEPIVAPSEDFQTLGQTLVRHGLQMPSIYLNSTLHTADWQRSVDGVVRQAREAKEAAGTRVVVVNPEPIAWGEPLDKSDDQLRVQARSLQSLGEALNGEDLRLAYHTHDAEMRHAAREFHHMMLATDATTVGLCLDSHWIYRGAGNSEIALGDIVKLYGGRIASLHLRQSQRGVWSETLEDGDINYDPLARTLQAMNFSGPIIIEQASEDGTPRTMTPLQAHCVSTDWARRTFSL